jgi:hypothetical protein
MLGHSQQALKCHRRAEETIDDIQTQTQLKTHTTQHSAQQQKKKILKFVTTTMP